MKSQTNAKDKLCNFSDDTFQSTQEKNKQMQKRRRWKNLKEVKNTDRICPHFEETFENIHRGKVKQKQAICLSIL